MVLEILDTALMPFMATFIFIFAIVLGLLTSTAIFKNKQVNVAIAFVFAVFAASYAPLVQGLQDYIPIAVIIFIVLFFVVLIKKAVAGSGQDKDYVLPAISLVILLVLLGVFWDELQYFLPIGLDPMSALWLIGTAIVVIILLLAYKHGKAKSPT